MKQPNQHIYKSCHNHLPPRYIFYLYIDYMMAIDEEDYKAYPANKFYRKNEIKKYFDNTWEIISCRENNFPTFEGAHVDCTRDHFHRFGYLLARRIK